MRKVLSKKFFERPAPEVAEDIIGKYLVCTVRGRESAFMITEVEAYEGFDDKASHASKGRTKRTEVMFGSAGVFYVYLVYGMYEMLNIVTGPKDYPAAVLVRGVESIAGPGRLTKSLKITRALSGKKATRESGLWIEERGVKISKKDIKKTPRIGVDYAGPVWSRKQYRFVLK
ncbi:DNA-3-methyladenine glycosylase II [hydrothermal vent metagenome]|uniref:DNA-3-methyladenine glycosylase II n=1 Tax=hydrothermal vent metagenome TaxID=652676 RepID=A0A3B0TNB8_9ZZZZ